MKCGICRKAVGAEWYSIARRFGTDRTWVTNIDPQCMDGAIGHPQRKRLDDAVLASGWVQEPLPLDIPAG